MSRTKPQLAKSKIIAQLPEACLDESKAVEAMHTWLSKIMTRMANISVKE